LFFDRFCFDLVSILGNNVYKLTFLDIEYIYRTVFVNLSHSFSVEEKGKMKYDGVKLLQLGSILQSPFDLACLQDLDKRITMLKHSNPSQQNQRIHVEKIRALDVDVT